MAYPGDTYNNIIYFDTAGNMHMKPGAQIINDAVGHVPIIVSLTNNNGGTVSNTLAAVTVPPTLINNAGGSPATTIAVITQLTTTGCADFAPTQNAISQLAVNAIADAAAIALLKAQASSLASKLNEVIVAMRAAGITVAS